MAPTTTNEQTEPPRCVGCGALQATAVATSEGTVLLCAACAAFADLGCP